MISYDFGMHRAGVFLGRRSLLLLLARRAFSRRGDRRRVLVMGVLCNRCVSDRKHNYTRDYCCNVCSHFVWL